MGWQEDPNNPGTIIKDTVSPLKIMSAENLTSSPEQTTRAYLSGVIDKNSTQLSSTNGLIVSVGIYDSLGYSYIAKFPIKDIAADGTKLPEGRYRLDTDRFDLVDSNGFSLMHSKSEPGYEKTGFDAVGGPAEGVTLPSNDWPKTMNVDLSGAATPNFLTYDTITGKSKDVNAAGNDLDFNITIGICLMHIASEIDYLMTCRIFFYSLVQ